MPRVPAQSNLVPAQSISGADPCCKFAEIEACEGSTARPRIEEAYDEVIQAVRWSSALHVQCCRGCEGDYASHVLVRCGRKSEKALTGHRRNDCRPPIKNIFASPLASEVLLDTQFGQYRC